MTYEEYYNLWQMSVQSRELAFDEWLCLMLERQKAIDEKGKKKLIEKVIWLIEDSYPDTNDWSHDALVRNVTDDLESRADTLNEMFD